MERQRTADPAVYPARSGDLEALTNLLRTAGLPVEDVSEELIGHFLVASTGASLVGCIGLEIFSSIGLLRSLVVDGEFRGAGVGRLLVLALEAYARQRGIGELWLLTIDADRYFDKLGYCVRQRDEAPEAIRRTAEFSLLCPADAVLMNKEI
jgi:amino-acid N-acetyltransferase